MNSGHGSRFGITFPSSGLLDTQVLAPLFPSTVSAGFDAIFQFRLDYLARYFARTMDTAGLSTLRAIVPLAEVTSSRPIHVVGGEPAAFEIVIGGARLKTLLEASAPPLAATVTWDVHFNLLIDEGGAPVIEARNVERLPIATERQPVDAIGASTEGGALLLVAPGAEVLAPTDSTVHLKTLPLAVGTVATSARILVQVRPTRYQTWAQLAFGGADVSLDSPSTLFAELAAGGLAEHVTLALDSILSGASFDITPHMSLTGPLKPGESVSDLDGFRVREIAAGVGNPGGVTSSDTVAPVDIESGTTAHEILSLCINVGEGTHTGDPLRVQSMVADRNFAYYLTERVLRAIVGVRWKRLKLPRGFDAEIPVDLKNPETDDSFVGRALIRLTVQETLQDAALAVSELDVPDALRVLGKQRVQLLRLWDGDNNEVKDLGELGTPVTTVLVWRLQLVVLDPRPKTDTIRFFDKLARVLLQPLYSPTVTPIAASRIDGVVSSPAGVVVLRSDLS